MEISKMLTLSTGHITRDTANLLESLADEYEDIIGSPIIYKKGDYGWFVHIPEELDEYSIPYDLLQVLEFAKRHDCDWLCLDCDGQEIEFLPQYEW